MTLVGGWDDPAVDAGARPVPVLQGLCPRLPDRHRHGDLQVRGAAPALPAPAAATVALRARPAAEVGPDDAAAAGQPDAADRAPRPGGEGGRRRRPAAGAAGVLGAAVAPARWSSSSRRRPGRTPSTSGCGPTRSPTGSPPTAGGRRSGCSRGPACGGGDPRGGLLRADLDHHRSARPGATDPRRSRRRPPPLRRSGVPVVGLEPSCLATLRSDAEELLDDPRAGEVARGVRSLAELLTGLDGWSPRDLSGVEVVAQPHCHQAAVLGWEGRPGPAHAGRGEGHPARRLLRAGRQLRGRAGALRGVGGDRRAHPAPRRTTGG